MGAAKLWSRTSSTEVQTGGRAGGAETTMLRFSLGATRTEKIMDRAKEDMKLAGQQETGELEDSDWLWRPLKGKAPRRREYFYY